MKVVRFVLLPVLVFVLLTAIVSAGGITYDFDVVEVHYATEFTVKPVNVESDNWLAQLAGGTDKSVQVLYGIVELKKNGVPSSGEEFIKVTGENGSERFLLNSASYGNITKSFFWSAKKLEGTSVVKDFSGTIRSLTLFRQIKPDGKVVLYASNDGEKANDEFWEDKTPKSNIYTLDSSTGMLQKGDPKIKIK